MEFKYDVKRNDDNQLIVSLVGDLDVYTAGTVKNDILESLDHEKGDVHLDCEKLEYMDSTGLGALISIYNKVKDADNIVYIENVKPNVKKIFEITEMDKIFNIRD